MLNQDKPFCVVKIRIALQISLPLTVGPRNVNLEISGRGFKDLREYHEEFPFKANPIPYTYNTEAKVILSHDEIAIERMLTWSKIERLLFIKNMTKNRVIAYCWEA